MFLLTGRGNEPYVGRWMYIIENGYSHLQKRTIHRYIANIKSTLTPNLHTQHYTYTPSLHKYYKYLVYSY